MSNADTVRSRQFTFGSLFAGIGGLDLGLERAGWACRWQSEIDPYCFDVLARQWPDVARYGDMTEVDWAAVEPVDLICGGFPCQPFSTMGLQKGTDDTRWLWPHFAECVRLVRPRFVLVENVPALKSNAVAFGRVLGDLHELGFDAEWGLVSACSVGAPHLRRRLFIVAHRRGERRQQESGGAHGDEGTHEADAPLQDDLPGRDAAPQGRAAQWASEPRVGYLADGLPPKLARLANRALGNAVVPQVAEWVARNMLPAASTEAQEGVA